MKLSEYYLENSKNGLSKSFKDSDEGVRIVNMKELFGYNPITDSVEMRQVLLTNSELDRFGLKYNDLLFGRRSLVYEGSGKTTIYKGSLPTVFESSIIRVRLDEEKLNPDFANYYFNSKVGRGNVLSIVTGAAVFGIRGSDLSNLKVDFPSLDAQKKIASILSAYDDLIENNNQRIKLLEEMAAEIYKEWFVRFRFPNYQNTKFLDKDGNEVAFGTKGAIPVGWEKLILTEVFNNIVLGGTPSRSVPKYWKDGTIDWIKSGKLNDQIILGGSEKITKKAVENSATELLPPKTVLIAITGAILIGFSAIELCANQSVIGIHTSNKLSQSYLYLDQKFHQRYYEDRMTGSAQQHINKEVVSNYKILVPDDNTSQKFNSIVDPMYDEIILLKRKNQILQDTRDLLLPRLISDKLSVEDLEVEELNRVAEPNTVYETK